MVDSIIFNLFSLLDSSGIWVYDIGMSRKAYVPNRVRPKNATPELAVELHKNMTLQQIADAWGVSKTAVWLLVKKAEKKAKER